MILPIYVEPQPILREECQPIGKITPEIVQLAEDMRETMHNAQGIGLAAPQIGRNICMCVIELSDPEDPEGSFPFLALINPRVTWKSPKLTNFVEACLSIPGVEGSVRRPEKVRVKALNLQGEQVQISAEGLLARVLQHEIDHLHGVLFTDYISKNSLKKRPLVEYSQL